MTTKQRELLKNIRQRGDREQENSLFFPFLRSGHRVTRTTTGYLKNFERELKQGKHPKY